MEVLDRGVEGLRIGVVQELAGDGIDGDVLDRLQEAAAALEKAGATVGEASVPAAIYGLSAYYLIAPAEASSNLARYDGIRYGLRVDGPTTGDVYDRTRTAGFGAEVKRRIMLGTYALSAGYYDAYYGKALKVRTLILQDFARAYERFDLLLAPTSPCEAFRFGDKTADPMTMYLNDVCTIPSNLSGQPAMSVPFGTATRPAGRGPDPGPDARRAHDVPSRRRPRGGGAHDRDRGAHRLGDRHRVGGPRRAGDGHQDVLRLPEHLRLRAQHQRVPGVPGAARVAARGERAGGRAGRRPRPRPRVRRPPERVRPQELSIPTCRRTTRSRSTTDL